MRTRTGAVVLALVSLGWFLMIPFIEKLPDAATVPDMIVRLGLLVLPPTAFIALILLTRRVVRSHEISRKEYWFLRTLCWFTGPVGCVIAVFRLTRTASAAIE